MVTMMINIALLFAYFVTYNPTTACQICIIDSTCADDYIHFNVSISNECEHPLKIYFSYMTEVNTEKHYRNKTIDCRNCHVDLAVDIVKDAWDYTLRLLSPEPTKTCSMRKARCGGNTSQYVWILTGSVSGLFVVFGAIICTLQYCRPRQSGKIKPKTVRTTLINS